MLVWVLLYLLRLLNKRWLLALVCVLLVRPRLCLVLTVWLVCLGLVVVLQSGLPRDGPSVRILLLRLRLWLWLLVIVMAMLGLSWSRRRPRGRRCRQ